VAGLDTGQFLVTLAAVLAGLPEVGLRRAIPELSSPAELAASRGCWAGHARMPQ